MVELLPCPFCGVEGELFTYYGGGKHNETVYMVMCNNDDCSMNVLTPDCLTEAQAIAAWNSRADYHGYEQEAICCEECGKVYQIYNVERDV